MEILLDPQLVEEAVVHEIDRREKEGDIDLFEEYHRRADPFYELSRGERETGFERLHRAFFRRLGMEESIAQALEEYTESPAPEDSKSVAPSLNRHGKSSPLAAPKHENRFLESPDIFTVKLPLLRGVSRMEIRKARSESEEGADLFRRTPEEVQGKVIGIRLLPTRLLDLPCLRRMLRHELMHIADMLDEAFLYQDEPVGSSPHEEAFIIDRYRVIWDLYIDSRLLKAGKETVSDQEGRLRELDRVYRKIPSSQRLAAFEVLWGMEKMDHPWILGLAKDPTRVLELGERGLAEGETKGERKRVLLPGFPCPLCNFPTYVWIESLEEELCEAVREDYPAWGPEEGICERCADLYRFRVEFPDSGARGAGVMR